MSIVSVKLMGGLGNCLFQIAAAYSVSLRDSKTFLCESSYIRLLQVRIYYFKIDIG